MAIIQLSSFPIEQVPSLLALEQRLGASFAGRAFPQRLLAFSQACSLRPAITRTLRDQLPLEQLQDALRPLLRELDTALAGDLLADPDQALRDLPDALREQLQQPQPIPGARPAG